MSYSAGMGLVANTLLVGPLVQRYGELGLMLGAAVVLVLSYLAVGSVTDSTQLLVLSTPIALASSMLYTAQGGALTKAVNECSYPHNPYALGCFDCHLSLVSLFAAASEGCYPSQIFL
jgi:MFS family permease